MKKYVCVFLTSTTAISLSAREIRTPLPILHYPLYQSLLIQQSDDWLIDGWIGGFFRKADEALVEKTNNTGKKQPLSQLIFGKSDFQAQQAFANAQATDPLNPFLDSIMSPRIKYIDRGVVIGVQGQKRLTEYWSIGIRGQLPFRSFKVKKTESPGTGTSIFGGETLGDVAQTKQEQFAGNTIQTYAIRLDFLSKLPANCTPLGLTQKLVQYNTPTALGHITIGAIDITNEPQSINNENQTNSVTAIKRNNKTAPTTFGLPVVTARALADLSADGTLAGANPLNNDSRAKFSRNVDYTPLGANPQNQSLLWIVPSVKVANDALLINALSILQFVDDTLRCTNNSPEATFINCDLSFDDQNKRGVGDFDIDLFAHYYFSDYAFIEGMLGLRAPTGKKIDNAGALFELPLGNNGHVEIKPGIKGTWEAQDWFQLNADASYSFVLNRTEKVPAAFAGALVKNLGPTVPARIHWGYFCGHIDTHFIAPINNQKHALASGFGYELYHKGKDSVKFSTTTTLDCLKKSQTLDASVIEKGTRVTAHKVYIDATYTYKTEKCLVGIFGGASWVVGGENTPREHDGFVGINFSVLI